MGVYIVFILCGQKFFVFMEVIGFRTGRDSLWLVSCSYVTVDAKEGNDLVTGSARYSSINGGDDNDTIEITGVDNIIRGGNGNDNITGTGNLYGESGNDVINGAGNITGGTGDDVISTDGCHNHNNIYYSRGDGNDVFTSHSDNDIIYLSGVALSSVTYSNGLNFYLNSGNTIRVNDADHKFIHISPGKSGSLETYVLNGTSVITAVSNFNSSVSVSDPSNTKFIYNGGKSAAVNGNGSNADFIYNSDMANYATIVGGKGNDTISEHSASAFVTHSKGDGNDVVTFDDTVQYNNFSAFGDNTVVSGNLYGRNNIEHYYGGGLFVVADGSLTKQISRERRQHISSERRQYHRQQHLLHGQRNHRRRL